MELHFNLELVETYKSNSQKARILTEDWVYRQSYCPNCGNNPLNHFENNRPVADFYCNHCSEEFELKSKKGNFSSTINDGAYATMMERVQADNNPNFFFLTYTKNFEVNNFLVLPKQFVTPKSIIQRKPLAPTARRAGWIGCNIDLSQVPSKGRIFLVKNGQVRDPEKVTKVDWNAFSGTGIKELIFPSSIKNLDTGIVDSCKNLEKIVFKGDTPPSIKYNSLKRNVENLPLKIYVPKGKKQIYIESSKYWKEVEELIIES